MNITRTKMNRIQFGVKKYNKLQKKFHKDIMEVILKHRKISADDCMIVFGRVYTIYVASQLELEGKIEFNQE